MHDNLIYIFHDCNISSWQGVMDTEVVTKSKNFFHNKTWCTDTHRSDNKLGNNQGIFGTKKTIYVNAPVPFLTKDLCWATIDHGSQSGVGLPARKWSIKMGINFRCENINVHIFFTETEFLFNNHLP